MFLNFEIKHHCRICLKIYCYYCCNSWVEYNNSSLRVCKKCFDKKENSSHASPKPSNEQVALSQATESPASKIGEVKEVASNLVPEANANDDDDDDDDPDINFEVRPEKLNSFNNSHEDVHDYLDESNGEDPDQDSISIYDTQAKPKSRKKKHDAAAKGTVI